VLANPLAGQDGRNDQQRLRCSEVVVKGRIELPTFRFSGGQRADVPMGVAMCRNAAVGLCRRRVPHCAVIGGGDDTRVGREGARKGVWGRLRGNPGRLWGRVPPWSPPARDESAVGRPLIGVGGPGISGWEPVGMIIYGPPGLVLPGGSWAASCAVGWAWRCLPYCLVPGIDRAADYHRLQTAARRQAYRVTMARPVGGS
jgi:hypothetical protein